MPVLTPAQGRSGRAGGLAGAREEEEEEEEGEKGGGASRLRGRQGGGHRSGVEKNEQTSKRWRGRAAEKRPGARSLPLSLFLDCPSVSLYDALPAATVGFLLPERFPLNVKTRSSTARSLLSPPFPDRSFSLPPRDLFRERARL